MIILVLYHIPMCAIIEKFLVALSRRVLYDHGAKFIPNYVTWEVLHASEFLGSSIANGRRGEASANGCNP